MNTSFFLFVNPSSGQRVAVGPAAALGFLRAFSQRRPRHDYCYSEREAGSGTVKRGVWRAVMAEMARRAHFTPPSE